MKPALLQMTFVAAGLAAGAWTANSAPLQRADVPDNPAWVLHLDCDGLRPTAIGQRILAEMDKPHAQAKLAAFQNIFSFDLRTQLHGLTLYGFGAAPKEGVLLVYADFDPAKLVTLAKAAKDAQNTPYKQHTIYNWIDEKKKPKNGVQPRVYAAIQGSRVLFGQREDAVAQALDVLDGATSSLASGNTFPELGAVGNTSFLEGAARKLDLPDSAPNAALLRLSRLIRLQVGEVQHQFNATLTLEANDQEIAGHMLSIAQGILGLIKLQTDKPEAVKLAEALAVKQDGPRVVAHLALPANDVIEMVQAHAARKAAKKAGQEPAATKQQQ